ncbi:putative sugar phosphate/phosphate translocator isoform B [Glycine soja]|uniref:Putative sugar phosphate/phosphate translocator isoform B n=1 Tax=Glycine soja TaxID=3848 RepID=A0A445KLN5_GLYSO|nr:putative sugar phosphate/phosphate translocator isoform B [Glycine soja]
MKGLNNRFFTVGLWRRGTLPTLACFKYPIFLTMCHMSYVAIAWMKVVPLQTLRSRVQFFKISALSLVFCVSVVFGNISLCYLPMSFNQAIGATMPFFIAVFAYLMTLKREAGLTYLTLVPVVTGVIIASGRVLLIEIIVMLVKEQMARVAKEEERGSPSWGASFFTQTTQDVARAVAAAVNSQRPCVVYAFKNDHGGSQLQRLQYQRFGLIISDLKIQLFPLSQFGGPIHKRLVQDLAFAAARFIIRGRSLWGKENKLTAEIDKLRAEVEKAEKSLDHHAIPGVSNPSF